MVYKIKKIIYNKKCKKDMDKRSKGVKNEKIRTNG